MKLTDFLQDIGRPVAYYPGLKKITGSTTATILLCQFIYWRGKESSGDGWLYKTSQEIEDETGLTYNEQKTARAVLVKVGLIQEHYARLDHQLKFMVNLDAINEKWGNPQLEIPQSDDSTLGNETSPYSLNSNTETTTENIPAKPDIVDAELKYNIKPNGIRDAIARHFKLTPNWEAKYNRQFLEWSVSISMTPEQIERAAHVWRMDKRFNWKAPDLRGIQEYWFQLIESHKTDEARPAYQVDANGIPETY